MRIERAFDHLLELEAEFDLFQREVNGIHYWDAVRSPVYFEALDQAGVYEAGTVTSKRDPTVREQVAGRAKGLYHGAKSLVYNSPLRTGRRDVLVVAAATERRERREDGKWWDVLCDPLCDRLTRSYVSLESSRAIHEYGVEPVKTEQTRYVDYVDTWYGIRGLLGDIDVSLDARERGFLAEVGREFDARFGSDVDLEAFVVEELRERAVKVPLYRNLLARIDPDVVIIRFSPAKSPLIHACRERGVPVIELQHGAISKFNPEFSYPDGVDGAHSTPDYVFLYGEFWARGVAYPGETYAVGWPYLEHCRRQLANAQRRDRLLFISAPAVGESLSKLAAAVGRRTNEYAVVYKLHPRERADWRRRYPWLVGADLTVVAGSEPTLYELMATSKAQVGVSSTAIYEGLNFGLATYLYAHSLLDNMHRLLETDCVTVVGSADDLLDSLDAVVPPPIDRDELFAPHAIERTNSAIEDVVRTHGS